MNNKKPIKRYILLAVIVAAVAYSYSWTYTEHGRLDYRAAVSLHMLSFEMKDFKPDPKVDFTLDLPVNLIYALSGMVPKAEVAKTEDIIIATNDYKLPARIYWPATANTEASTETTEATGTTAALPVIVYLHGGGFVVGSVDIFDPLTRSLANAANAIVISVDYRLAPAHPFPAAVNDGYAALEWAAANAERLGGDPTQLIVGGDSAGGNLTAVVALKAKQEQGPAIAAQIMYYPATDLTDKSYPSKEKFMDGYGLSSAAGKAFEKAYISEGTNSADPYVSPIYADNLANLPPALIVTAGFDPLTDSGTAYAEKLSAAGVKVSHQHYADMIHGFMSIDLFSQQRDALHKTREFLEQVLPASK